jgi:putative membrane protein
MSWHGDVMGSLLVGALALIAFGGVITAVIVIGWRASRGFSAEGGQSRARQLLDERLARGEIDVEEYRRTVELLARSS